LTRLLTLTALCVLPVWIDPAPEAVLPPVFAVDETLVSTVAVLDTFVLVVHALQGLPVPLERGTGKIISPFNVPKILMVTMWITESIMMRFTRLRMDTMEYASPVASVPVPPVASVLFPEFAFEFMVFSTVAELVTDVMWRLMVGSDG